MKSTVYLLFALICSLQLVAQEKSDTTEFIIGDKKIVIYDATKIEIDSSMSGEKDKAKTFNAWAGMDLGFNLLRTSNNSLSMPEDLNYMELDYGRSSTWNFNSFDVNWDWLKSEEKFGYNKRNLGIISGLGLSFENYAIKNNYTITNLNDSTFGVLDTIRSYTKNKLRTLFVKVPLMFQFYTMKKDGNKTKHSFHLAAGVVGGLRLSSSYKVKYELEGDNFKDKVKDDFNMSPFSLDAEVRIGYGSINLFASYGLTPLFEDNRGPELYPMTLGLSLTQLF